MIEIYYQSVLDQNFVKWYSLGFFHSVGDAIIQVEFEIKDLHDLIPFDEYTYSLIRKKSGNLAFQLKFFDTELNDYISIESPWKVGLK